MRALPLSTKGKGWASIKVVAKAKRKHRMGLVSSWLYKLHKANQSLESRENGIVKAKGPAFMSDTKGNGAFNLAQLCVASAKGNLWLLVIGK